MDLCLCVFVADVHSLLELNIFCEEEICFIDVISVAFVLNR